MTPEKPKATLQVAAVVLALLGLMGCRDITVDVPPPISIAELLAAPDTIHAGGKQLYLATYLWRDFQPVSPPDGKALTAVVYLTTTDSTRMPRSVSTDAVWIVHNGEVWAKFLRNEATPLQEFYRLARIARDGPKWGPHVYVEVIIRVHDGNGNAQLLRASNQWINRTD